MQRLFTLLIISILFSHSAWAFHDIELNNTHDNAYTQEAGQNDVDEDSYDHCGHASSHLVGIHSETTLTFPVESNIKIVSVENIASSISYQPPVPPPTS